ncbi:hypothetical protein B0H66DRAFT_597470 [Apodospora peruviana]|uniref:Expansin-like EG45 domain-containing protein n=1 Tax=Apodospora peruviana TaxID=516989 RepID=A0AAE0MG98_9PEZI|nr:hypothetical protein B0H66DRAFT_597470 [Apodospora peruviana]
METTHGRDLDTAKEVVLPKPNIGEKEVCPSECLPLSSPEIRLDDFRDDAPEVLASTQPKVISPLESPPITSKTQGPNPSPSLRPARRIRSWLKRHRKAVIIITCLLAFVLCLAVVGIVVGIVISERSWSSQMSSFSPSAAASAFATVSVARPSSTDLAIGKSYTATFEYYGSGDFGDSPNCNTTNNACELGGGTGYTAGVSEALFGAAPGAGLGQACGTCWRLDPDPSTTAAKGANLTSIVVLVNNLCPAKSSVH